MTMPWIFNSSSVNDELSSPTSSTTSSSSIGKNSDFWGSEPSSDSEEESEVQSVYKAKIDLTDALPIRRGISEFYNGRSKSFACVADASSYSSIKDIAKPDNAYIKRRRSLLAFNLSRKEGISKRPIGSSPTALMALGVALSRSESINSNFTTLSPKLTSLHPNLPSLHITSTASHNNLSSMLFPHLNVNLRSSISLPDLAKYVATKSTR